MKQSTRRNVLLAAAAMGSLSLSSAFVPHVWHGVHRGSGAGGVSVLAHRRVQACRSGRMFLAIASLVAVDEEVGGGEMPKRKLKKEMPAHVKSVLREVSTREDAAMDPMTLDDFKGLGNGDVAASKTIGNELYVKGLPFDLDHIGVRKLFLEAGYSPKSVRVLKDRNDKTRSIGWGFVLFKTEKDANAAMKAMQGKEIKTEAATTILSISKASSKGKERQMSSRTKRTDFQHQVDIRKMQLTFDTTKTKPVTSLERMPRAYRVMADKNAKVCLRIYDARVHSSIDPCAVYQTK